MRVALLLLAAVFAPVVHAAKHSPAPGGLQHGAASQGYLGIEFHDCADPHQHGAEVVMVDHDGPAGQAGLRPHDIITGVNGQLIDSAQSLKRIIHEAGANVQVALQVVRFGKPVTVNARLADRSDVERQALQRLVAPQEEAASAPPPGLSAGFADRYAMEPAPAASPTPASKQSLLREMLHVAPFTGIAMEAMEPQLAGFFGAPSGAGLLVNTVLPNSPAASAGLRAGDVVLRADTILLKTPADWTRHLRAAKGSAITLTILRDKHEQTLTLVPELKRKSALLVPGHITA